METNNNPSSDILRLFEVRTANQVLKDAFLTPDPIELYPPLIIQGELIILFADTGIGKTALIVQIGIHIAKSNYVVLYVDLELSDKQFEKRYRDDNGVHFEFPENFYRAGYSTLRKMPEKDYDRFFIDSLKESISGTNATVIIIDNMTKVVAGDTDSAKNAIPIMNSLTELKLDQKLTFIILEHNKKVDDWRPISLNDLQGSKMKSNFADSVFTIGRSAKEKSIRYIKQLKVRSAELEYDGENVLICELSKDKGFLGFKEIGKGNEYDLIRTINEDDKIAKIERMMELKAKGLSNVLIAKELGVSEGAIRKWSKS
ncbi:AAA family ATPase [Pedobacter fastidiosus]|uniref:AAA family ATPase n=1 Tax=Pedobacter fastidiosus TaxID=2765361 RepID=A0ABR7KXU0_9SPHI|nr:AAA family ATPase [Pedobacter fastidiosus]MBC6112508.1 AAA family ATPase [Pedobacter fastidiosus]